MSGSGPDSNGICGRWRSSEAALVIAVSDKSGVRSGSHVFASTQTAHALSKHVDQPCQYSNIHHHVSPADPSLHRWHITNYVDIHGNQHGDLRFELILSDVEVGSDGAGGLVGFQFVNDGCLSVWPSWLLSGLAPDAPLRLVPDRSQDGLQQLAQGLQALSMSDWHLLKCLCDLMVSHYADLVQGDQQMLVWLNGLKRFAKLLDGWPASLRMDRAVIQSVVQQGAYAHLSLSLLNMMTSRGIFEAWDFRLATVAANGVFDANPRLEFGRGTSQTVFEKWFVESRNAFGDNLEVRFTKQDQLVDLPLVWNRLTDTDRQLVGQLVELLPQILERVTQPSSPDSLQDLEQEGMGLFDGFKQVAHTMRLCWRTQLGTAWE